MKKTLLVILIISSNIYSQNTPPVALDQSVDTTKGTVKEITLVATDIDNDVLTYVIKSLPQNGNLKDGNTTITQSDLPRILGSSTLKYIPAAGFSGNDSFTFVARDLSIASFAAANGLTIINNNGEPVTYNKPAGKTYFLIDSNTGKSGFSPVDWTVAKTATDSYDGAKMYIILNAEMEKLVWDGLGSMGLNGSGTRYWLGLYQDKTSPDYAEPGRENQNWGGWTWVDGVTLKDRGYQNWWPGEPNNAGQEDYGQMNFGNNGIKWNDMRPGNGQSWPLFEFTVNDSGSESNVATVSISVSGEGFNLPDNNNKISVGSCTCNGKKDGYLQFSVIDANYDYTVTVSGVANPIKINGTSKSGSVTGLGKGTYTVCFKVDGQANYEQCFEAVISEPDSF